MRKRLNYASEFSIILATSFLTLVLHEGFGLESSPLRISDQNLLLHRSCDGSGRREMGLTGMLNTRLASRQFFGAEILSYRIDARRSNVSSDVFPARVEIERLRDLWLAECQYRPQCQI